MLLPSSADRRPLCDLQLGGLEPAVGVWSGLGRAIMASDTFCFTKPKRKVRAQRALFSSFEARKRDAYCCCRRSSSPAKSRREAPPSPQMSNPVVEKASRRDPDEQLEFQGGELR